MSTFFQQIAEMIGQNNSLSLNIIVKENSMTVGVVPGVNSNNKMPMLTIAGSPQEMDEGFFSKIHAPVTNAIGLVTNAEDFEKEAKKIADGIKEKATTKLKTEDAEADKKSDKKVAKPAKDSTKTTKEMIQNSDTSEAKNEEVTPVPPAEEQTELFS